MAEHGSGYKHSDSDRKLDQAAQAADTSGHSAGDFAGPDHNAAEVRRHDDSGKDGLFEAREQHDAAEKASEKSRLAKEIPRHDHSEEESPGTLRAAATSPESGAVSSHIVLMSEVVTVRGRDLARLV